MNFCRHKIAHEIFSAITQNKWLAVEYKNKSGGQTSYWIAIRDIDAKRGTLSAEGFHITKKTFLNLDKIYIDSILHAHIIDESFYAAPENLKNKIRENPDDFQKLFGNVANLRILDYLEECVNLNSVPYKSEYSLLERFDADAILNGECKLDDEQFSRITRKFHSIGSSFFYFFHFFLFFGKIHCLFNWIFLYLHFKCYFLSQFPVNKTPNWSHYPSSITSLSAP